MDDLDRVSADYAAVCDRLREIEAEGERLDQERLQLLEQARELEAALRVLRRLRGQPEPMPIDPGLGDLRSLTVARACQRLLEARGGEGPTLVLVRTLEEAGKFTGGSRMSHYATVVRTLKREPATFFQPATGRWALVALRPGGNGNGSRDVR